jgi:hypothetical protein
MTKLLDRQEELNVTDLDIAYICGQTRVREIMRQHYVYLQTVFASTEPKPPLPSSTFLPTP